MVEGQNFLMVWIWARRETEETGMTSKVVPKQTEGLSRNLLGEEYCRSNTFEVEKKNSIVQFVQVKFEIPVGHGSGDVR